MSSSRVYRLGTRKSDLAKAQSQFILTQLSKLKICCELIEIESRGDKDLEKPLYEIETLTPGLFTKQLEEALIDNSIDLAVHSLKDLPTDQPKGLKVMCIPKREAVEDCLVFSRDSLDRKKGLGLRERSVIGTSSLRREALILCEDRNLGVAPIRGNVPTRLRLVREGKWNAVVLAQAGLNRLCLDMSGLEFFTLPKERFVPAPGQGALAVETRTTVDEPLSTALLYLNDPITNGCTRVERSVLAGLHGGCTLPLGVHCERISQGLKLTAFLGVYEPSTKPRRWTRFKRFDISDSSEDTLVTRAIAHFRDDVNAMR